MVSSILFTLVLLAKSGIGLWIWSVWSWRLRSETNFRGGEAKNLFEEFQTYGFPPWVFTFVGAVKLSCASMLVVSIIIPSHYLTLIGSLGMFMLMGVANWAHYKVQDEQAKYIPAATMFTLSTYILIYSLMGEGASEPSLDDTPSRVAMGIVVLTICSFMAFRSFQNGDYDMSNYKPLEEAPDKASQPSQPSQVSARDVA